MHYTWDEAKEASAGQPHTIAFIGYIPTVTAPEYYQRNEKRTVYLLFAKRMIKKKSRGRRNKGNGGGRETASWKLGHKIFGATCSVYMTSCTVSHYLLSLDAERLRPAGRNGK